jgi:pimeloyl-ACP methyl ester carboxylesterase
MSRAKAMPPKRLARRGVLIAGESLAVLMAQSQGAAAGVASSKAAALAGKAPAKRTPAEAAAFDRFLATKTFAVKDSPAAGGRFSVVIYHPGLAGSHEDNSVLFEYLASHGYVVLSSTYPDPSAYSVSCGGDLTYSFRDMEFPSRYARGLPFDDAGRFAAMGHSYGAYAVLAWAAEPNSSVRAFVTLDSGLEYDTIESSVKKSLTEYILGIYSLGTTACWLVEGV